MRAAPLRYGAALGLVVASRSGLTTRQCVPAPQTCAGAAQLATYQRRFASTANNATTPWKKTKPKAATDPKPANKDVEPKTDVGKLFRELIEEEDEDNYRLEVLKSAFRAEAMRTGTKVPPEWILGVLAQRQLTKEKVLVPKIAGKLVSYSDYINSLDANPSILGDFVFVPQLRSSPVGLSTLANGIESHVENLRPTLKTHSAMQYTASLVIQNASGVGKTFGSVAAAGILNSKGKDADYYLPIYIGLNDVFPITKPEIDLLRDRWQQTDMDRVRAVIGRRLLLQLEFISDKLADGNLKLWEVVESTEHLGFHLTPAPSKISTFCSHKEFPLFDKEAVARCVELIQQLSTYCDGRKLVVLFIVDEGQKLDHFIKPVGNEGGARLALQLGRELQLSCSDNTKDSFLLTIMTGNPCSSLSDTTEGTNFEYREPLHSMDEFVDIALSLDHEVDEVRRRTRSRRIAALLYPVVRDLALVYEAENSKTVQSTLTPDFILAPSEAQLMMMASCTNTFLHISKWHTLVPAIFAGAYFLPVPLFYHLSNYLRHFSWLKRTLKGKRTFAVSEQYPLDGQDHSEFVTAAIDILSVILALTNMPGEPEVSIAAEYERIRTDWLEENEWFNLTRKTDISLEPKELYKSWYIQYQCYLPSSSRARDAFLVTPSGQNVHPLHSGTRAHLDALTKEGELFSMVCRGFAPVAFIFVMLKTSRVKDTDPCEVELRLADAKHTGTGDKEDIKGIKEMLERFQLVSEYLQAALKKECNMTVKGVQFAIVTNKVDAEQSILDDCDPNGTLKDIIAKTHVLSPATFRFPPLTTRLFD